MNFSGSGDFKKIAAAFCRAALLKFFNKIFFEPVPKQYKYKIGE
jgi:hypothetical protein